MAAASPGATDGRLPGRGGNDPVPAVAVVVSRYNESITSRLLEGSRRAYATAGGRPEALVVVDAPGAYELVALSAAAARSGRCAGVVALGCIIRGETDHDRYIAAAVAHGLTEVTIATGVPVAFGVLTVNNVRQARERAGGAHGNKGEEAMQALLATIVAAAELAGGGSVSRKRLSLPDKAAGNGSGRKSSGQQQLKTRGRGG